MVAVKFVCQSQTFILLNATDSEIPFYHLFFFTIINYFIIGRHISDQHMAVVKYDIDLLTTIRWMKEETEWIYNWHS